VLPGSATEEASEAAGRSIGKVARSFWSVVVAVELADLAFSLDNVVAAVALSREFWVVLTGVALGIITMRFAAGIFVRLIARYPELEAAAYLLVFNIGIMLLMEDFLHIRLSDVQKFLMSLSTLGLTILWGRSEAVRRFAKNFTWLKTVLGIISFLFIVILKPFAWILGGTNFLVRAIVLLFYTRRRMADAERAD